MDLRFLSGALHGVCNSRAAMVKRWGEKLADAVGQRLHELDAADRLGDLADLPFIVVSADDGDGRVEIRDTEDLVVVVGHLPDRDDVGATSGEWREATALTISDVTVPASDPGRR